MPSPFGVPYFFETAARKASGLGKSQGQENKGDENKEAEGKETESQKSEDHETESQEKAGKTKEGKEKAGKEKVSKESEKQKQELAADEEYTKTMAGDSAIYRAMGNDNARQLWLGHAQMTRDQEIKRKDESKAESLRKCSACPGRIHPESPVFEDDPHEISWFRKNHVDLPCGGKSWACILDETQRDFEERQRREERQKRETGGNLASDASQNGPDTRQPIWMLSDVDLDAGHKADFTEEELQAERRKRKAAKDEDAAITEEWQKLEAEERHLEEMQMHQFRVRISLVDLADARALGYTNCEIEEEEKRRRLEAEEIQRRQSREELRDACETTAMAPEELLAQKRCGTGH